MDELKQKFENIVRQEKGTIYSLCMMFAADRSEADDLAQETLTNLWLGLPKFRNESSCHTWVYRITLNTCISYERKNKSKAARTDIEIDYRVLSEDTDVGRSSRLLHQRIQLLDTFDRAIVLLWLEDLSYDEIGAIVGISAKAVSVRLVRIREKLKKLSVNEK